MSPNSFRRLRLSLFIIVLCGLGLSAGPAIAQGAKSAAPVHKEKPAAAMSTKGNKAILQRIYEVFNAGDLVPLDQLIAADAVDHNPFPGQTPGLEGIKQMFTAFRTAFPDAHQTVEDMIAEGDKVVARVTLTGTQKGAFMGIASTGKKVTVTGIDIVRFANGKAVEHWGNEDDLGMMQQLGALPPMEKKEGEKK